MRITREKIPAIIMESIGVIGFILSIFGWLSTRESDLARKITSAQNIISHCDLSDEKERHIMTILLQADKKLNIEGNYNEATDLINSVWGELWNCQPKGQISEPYLMLFTIFIIMIVTGALFLVRKPKSVDGSTK